MNSKAILLTIIRSNILVEFSFIKTPVNKIIFCQVYHMHFNTLNTDKMRNFINFNQRRSGQTFQNVLNNFYFELV